MKLIPAFLALGALLLPGALPADTFEGTVALTMTTSKSNRGPQALSFSLKEGYMRTDVVTERGTMSSIMDLKNLQMIILMPQQRMYMVQPIPQPPAGQAASGAVHAPDATLTDTGERETILGYDCRKYVLTSDKATTELWVTDQLGTFMGLYHGGGPGHRGEAPPAWESTLRGRNFFPMRVVTTADGHGTFRLDVTSVEKAHLDESLFEPPAGWRKFDLSALMGGAMQGGFPGSRPDGNN